MFVKDLFESALAEKCKLKGRKLHMESCTYTAFYEQWREDLFERAMRLFIWDTKGTVPEHEIELRLVLDGKCAITRGKNDDAMYAMFTSMHGITEYSDIYLKGFARCPKWTKQVTWGEDAILIQNDALKTAIYPLIHHYAMLLAHAEISFIDSLIGLRDLGGAPVVKDEQQKESVLEYQAKRFNGEYGTMRDMSMLGIDYLGGDRSRGSEIASIWETRNKILNAFYADLGVKTAIDKRSNTIVEEVEADNSMLLLNISDMLKWREQACEDVYKLFGVRWSVKVNPEINYDKGGAADDLSKSDERESEEQ